MMEKQSNLIQIGFSHPIWKIELYKNTEGKNMAKNWNKAESQIFKFENVGDEIEGELISREDSRTFNNKVYKIKTSDGDVKTVFGTSVLDSLLNVADIGSEVKIVRLEDKENKKKGQNPIKMFDVFTA